MLSNKYRKMLEETHHDTAWGSSSINYVGHIVDLIKDYNAADVLDYGAGKQMLAKELMIRCPGVIVHSYDPGISEISQSPNPASFVCCTDVLEHVEPEFIDEVLDDLKRVVLNIGYFIVSVKPAQKILPDGRNAHLIVKPTEWWREQFDKRFNVKEQYDTLFIVCPK
jgi:16S rRNA A1518/A1519 N6-dimethyltransferase RsmA/KsgA/DIM1 with predicted DNA glycosylase/AP lyase activity